MLSGRRRVAGPAVEKRVATKTYTCKKCKAVVELPLEGETYLIQGNTAPVRYLEVVLSGMCEFCFYRTRERDRMLKPSA